MYEELLESLYSNEDNEETPDLLTDSERKGLKYGALIAGALGGLATGSPLNAFKAGFGAYYHGMDALLKEKAENYKMRKIAEDIGLKKLGELREWEKLGLEREKHGLEEKKYQLQELKIPYELKEKEASTKKTEAETGKIQQEALKEKLGIDLITSYLADKGIIVPKPEGGYEVNTNVKIKDLDPTSAGIIGAYLVTSPNTEIAQDLARHITNVPLSKPQLEMTTLSINGVPTEVIVDKTTGKYTVVGKTGYKPEKSKTPEEILKNKISMYNTALKNNAEQLAQHTIDVGGQLQPLPQHEAIAQQLLKEREQLLAGQRKLLESAGLIPQTSPIQPAQPIQSPTKPIKRKALKDILR